MRERPILFNGPMVRAILDGRKTQTRRKVTNVRGIGQVTDFGLCDTPGYAWQMRDRRARWNELRAADLLKRSPCGIVGDRLWVRETWADIHPVAIQAGRYSQPGRAGIPGPPSVSYRTIYRADGEALPHWRRADHKPPYFTNVDDEADPIYRKYNGGLELWTPSIHMPRWASRLVLEVTDARVERLQSISEADACAEGMGSPITRDCKVPKFAALWDELNGSGAWEANPWVWAITFKRVEVSHG